MLLVQCSLNDSFITEFSNLAPFIPSLINIDLSSNHCLPSLSSILSSYPRVCSLSLSKMHCDVISNSLSLSPSITHIDLSYCLRTFDQLLSLANSPCLCTLNYLNLKSCHVSSHGFRVLALSFNLRNLKVLILRNNQISDIKHVSDEDIDMDKIMKL